MSNWGTAEFNKAPEITRNLERVVIKLTPKAKQAMYGAARAKTISKKTWDGCAFNAAGDTLGELGHNISSIERASEVFGLSTTVVDNFIKVWDGLPGTNEESTEQLLEVLMKIGLFTEPEESRIRRVIRTTLYQNVEQKLLAELETAFEDETIEGVCEARELLFA